MIVNNIEKIVKNASTAVTMTLKGVKFICSPVAMTEHNKPYGSVWYYIDTDGNRWWDGAREMFADFLQDKCSHNNKELNTSGGMSYGAGDVSDTTVEELFCLDCGATIEEEN